MARQTSTASKWTVEQKRAELWRRGVLAPWILHDGQKKMYEAVQSSTSQKFVINSSRRLGKSFMLCLIALETAIQKPSSQIKFAAPNQKAARKIITPLMKQILETCPRELRPKFKLHDGLWEFRNGSEIHVAGSEQGQIDSLRGQACDLALLDEAAFMNDLEYVVESVIAPQTLTRPDSRIILASTPPVSPDHAFVRKYMANAMAQGSYARFTIYDNPMLTTEKIEEYMFEAGGENSTTWRREYLAEVVTETDFALFPEASNDDIMAGVVTEIRRPDFYIPFTAIDLGYLDNTGVVFGYYHFPSAKAVIEDELLMEKKTSAYIVEKTLEKERELWGEQRARGRVVDGNALAIADLNETHRFNCRVPDKSDLAANVNRVRMDLMNQKLIVDPKCTNLIAQLKFSTWDKNRTKFSRSSDGGHWDLVAATIYWAKHLDRHTNPMPADYGYSAFEDWGYPRQHTNSLGNTLKDLFPVRRRKGR